MVQQVGAGRKNFEVDLLLGKKIFTFYIQSQYILSLIFPQGVHSELGNAARIILGEIASADLDWVLEQLTMDDEPLDEDALMSLLDLPSGTETRASIAIARDPLHVVRLDAAEFPHVFGFTRKPQPLEGEKQSTRAPD